MLINFCMKKPNCKLYFRLAYIELTVMILSCVAAIVGLLFILDTTYPFFKYTSLFSYIVCFTLIPDFVIAYPKIFHRTIFRLPCDVS